MQRQCLLRKGISLNVNIWQSDASRYVTNADLELIIDSQVYELKKVNFQLGAHNYEGATATLNDYRLVQMIAHGNDEWFTANVTPKIRVKLTPEMLLAINAIMERYNSLESPGSRPEQVDE